VYETASKTWFNYELGGSVPSPRERCSLVLLGQDSLVLFGGYYCSKNAEEEYHYNDTHILNLERMVWTIIMPKGNIPKGRFAHTAGCISKKMYMFGGVNK